MHDLLTDPLIGIRAQGATLRVCLPELLARLAAGNVDDYTGLRPHQEDPWHVFLVQIAASILARQPKQDTLPGDIAFWRKGLLDLADGQGSAWELLVEDVTKPAFLQHPLKASAELIGEFKAATPKARTPDELDVLVTSKNHDVKSSRARPSDPEVWIFALVCSQTMCGFLGAGNYGIARMNGGFGSRAIVSLVSNTGAAARFVEETLVVCSMRSEVLAGKFGYCSLGIVLTWQRAWERKAAQYLLSELEPWFIETARPLRLVSADIGMAALGATSAARQIGPKSIDNGDLGDPWTVMNLADKKKGQSALTLSASGWSAERLSAILFEQDFELTSLQRPRAGMTNGAWFVGSVLVRGQGTTEGLHRFKIHVPPKVGARLLNRDSRRDLASIANDLIADAKAAERALKASLTALAEGHPQEHDFDRKAVAAWTSQAVSNWSRYWQSDFFPTIWRSDVEGRDAAMTAWRAMLVAQARHQLRTAENRLPISIARRYRALVGAEQVLRGSLRKAGLIPDHSEFGNQSEKEVSA